jgi:hypothetical protein
VYSRILERVDREDWQVVHRIFTWLVASKEPLNADTLAMVPSIDPDERSVNPGLRFLTPREDILKLCGSLVKIIAGKFGRHVIVLAHYSVEEYLLRLPSDGRTSLSHFAIRRDWADSHICAASIVLFQWLEAQGQKSKKERIETRRTTGGIRTYCLKHWLEHASSPQVQIERMDLIRSFLRDWRGWCWNLDFKITFRLPPIASYWCSKHGTPFDNDGNRTHCGCPETEPHIARSLGLHKVAEST